MTSWHVHKLISKLSNTTIIIISLLTNAIYPSTCRCCCGQSRIHHPTLGIEIGSPVDSWTPYKHTRMHPTDAYGTIEFQGGAHPTKAQVSQFASCLSVFAGKSSSLFVVHHKILIELMKGASSSVALLPYFMPVGRFCFDCCRCTFSCRHISWKRHSCKSNPIIMIFRSIDGYSGLCREYKISFQMLIRKFNSITLLEKKFPI